MIFFLSYASSYGYYDVDSSDWKKLDVTSVGLSILTQSVYSPTTSHWPNWSYFKAVFRNSNYFKILWWFTHPTHPTQSHQWVKESVRVTFNLCSTCFTLLWHSSHPQRQSKRSHILPFRSGPAMMPMGIPFAYRITNLSLYLSASSCVILRQANTCTRRRSMTYAMNEPASEWSAFEVF